MSMDHPYFLEEKLETNKQRKFHLLHANTYASPSHIWKKSKRVPGVFPYYGEVYHVWTGTPALFFISPHCFKYVSIPYISTGECEV